MGLKNFLSFFGSQKFSKIFPFFAGTKLNHQTKCSASVLVGNKRPITGVRLADEGVRAGAGRLGDQADVQVDAVGGGVDAPELGEDVRGDAVAEVGEVLALVGQRARQVGVGDVARQAVVAALLDPLGEQRGLAQVVQVLGDGNGRMQVGTRVRPVVGRVESFARASAKGNTNRKRKRKAKNRIFLSPGSSS